MDENSLKSVPLTSTLPATQSTADNSHHVVTNGLSLVGCCASSNCKLNTSHYVVNMGFDNFDAHKLLTCCVCRCVITHFS